MAYYYPIQNEKLRTLVITSESIHSLADDDVQKMVSQISNLTDEGQMAMIQALEDEQKQIMLAKAAQGITPQMEMRQLQADSMKLTGIKHDFEMAVVKENQKMEQADANNAEDILRDI